MEQEFKFRELEKIAMSEGSETRTGSFENFSNAEYRIDFESLYPSDYPKTEVSNLIETGDWQKTLGHYESCVQTPGFIASGIINAFDYYYFGNCALPIDIFRHEIIVGEPLCWGEDFAKWYCGNNEFPEFWGVGQKFKPFRELRRRMNSIELSGEYVLLSAPGQDIYGHWLIDFVPRLNFINKIDARNSSIILDRMPQWAKYFIGAFDIDEHRIINNPGRFFKLSSALIPTSAKSGYRLGETACSDAWKILNNYHDKNFLDKEIISPKKIFLSRSKLDNSNRSLKNRTQIEHMMEVRGYAIMYPEQYSISDQVNLMRKARVIVGEDGSALHNIIFCQPGAVLGVISLPERENLWHLGIGQILEHKVGYCQTDANNFLDVKVLAQFLDKLEASASGI